MALTYEEGQWIRDNNDVEESESKRMREVTKAKKEMIIVGKKSQLWRKQLDLDACQGHLKKGGNIINFRQKVKPI
jgi:hypothetical protein